MSFWLANAGSTDLEIVEVQTGSYLGEDDIKRYEDDFARGARHELKHKKTAA